MKKIVFITANDLFDENGNGGSKCAKRNYDLLEKHFGKENISVVLLTLPKYITEVKGITMKCFPQPRNIFDIIIANCMGCKKYRHNDERKIRDYIDSVQPDYVYFECSNITKLLRKKALYKQVVFFQNVEADYAWNKVKKEGWRYLPAFFTSLINEKKVKYADILICLNDRDKKRLKEKYGFDANCCWPITFKDLFEKSKLRVKEKNKLLFLGSNFGPNRDGIKWFIENVMPHLSGYILDVVGKGFEELKDSYAGYSNVNIIGTVDNPSDYYYTHNIVVMPILYGAGMKVKTAEAMMHGNTIIATDEALEGYEVDGIEGIYRCNTVEQFVSTIENIKQISCGYNENVRTCFLEKYETSVLKGTLNSLFVD
ncbi:Glycosyltransferase involved in cell wall bisynthesis [Pseudobutyrivibrio sp. NOR37]|uniref:Glycosyltransferase family 4 protein n=1 Tax=Pseudobutyrivibrio xylanivorans TaxID=185007 RepID=A0A6M0LIE7_PSEXY|nr:MULTISPECIES: glycosyltransferase [Pseudobutyrivibrio]NEX02305.1 glycosyltransferase family 4 protein [Pseudobutyrivibrio xylanivorans]SFR77946.1 Glycosyltransferase involved in cell wall bisynthesis [Pseudobutyrivibrio sp. NOR37]